VGAGPAGEFHGVDEMRSRSAWRPSQVEELVEDVEDVDLRKVGPGMSHFAVLS
jgi:hypothetical protein